MASYQYHNTFGRLQVGSLVLGDPLVAIPRAGVWNGKDNSGWLDLYFSDPIDHNVAMRGGCELPKHGRIATWELNQPNRKVAQKLLEMGYVFDASRLRHIKAYLWESYARCSSRGEEARHGS